MVLKLEKEKQEILEKNIKLIHNRFSSRCVDDSSLEMNNAKGNFNTLQCDTSKCWMNNKCN